MLQTGLPMAALSVLGAQFRLKQEDRSRLMTDLIPWAVQAGSRCADLMCLRYESHFQVPPRHCLNPQIVTNLAL